MGNTIEKMKITRALAIGSAALLSGMLAVAQMPGGGSPSTSQQNPSQMPSSQTPGATTGADQGNAASPQSFSDQAFVKDALAGGDTEVALGKLAQEKSQSSDVKQFGQKMVSDHTQMADKLMKPIAKQINVSEPKGPSKKDKQLIAKLEGLSGDAFDQAYIEAMVKDHKKDLKDFQDEGQATQNSNLQIATKEGAQMIEQHLQLIQQIAQNHKVATEASK